MDMRLTKKQQEKMIYFRNWIDELERRAA